MRNPFIALILLAIGCVFTTRTSVADDARHLFILAGQSNMRQPLPDSFRHCVEQVFGKDGVIVLAQGYPSQPIKSWYTDWKPPAGMNDDKPETNGSLYDKLLDSVRRTVSDKPLKSVTYIWMQGEADAGNGWGSVYAASFLGILEQFKRDLEIDQINFVLGRINEHWLDKPDGELVRSVQQQLGEKHANGDWIDTDDLNRGVNPWGGYSFEDGHFPPPGYRVMGQRFAWKACQLIAPDLKLDADLFKENFFDSADDVRTHAAIGKEVIGSQPDPKHDGGGAGLSALTDGKFGNSESTDKAWIGFTPSDQTIELLIDLGEVMPVESIAVNMLLSPAASAGFPDKIVYSTSEDGQVFQINNSRYNTIRFANTKKRAQMSSPGIESQSILILTEQQAGRPPSAALVRYVKIEITPGAQRVFLDEIIVNPSPL